MCWGEREEALEQSLTQDGGSLPCCIQRDAETTSLPGLRNQIAGKSEVSTWRKKQSRQTDCGERGQGLYQKDYFFNTRMDDVTLSNKTNETPEPVSPALRVPSISYLADPFHSGAVFLSPLVHSPPKSLPKQLSYNSSHPCRQQHASSVAFGLVAVLKSCLVPTCMRERPPDVKRLGYDLSLWSVHRQGWGSGILQS